MTNEQCIAVAEKGWGWKHRAPDALNLDRWLSPGSEPGNYNQEYSADDLKREVNSWSGFGRTLEKSINPSSIWKFTTILREYLDGSLTKEQFIEAIHLVALEAVRKEKE